MVYGLVRKVIKPSHRKVFSFSFRSILFRVITHNKVKQKERFHWKIVGDLFNASGFESKASMFSIKITQNMVTMNQPTKVDAPNVYLYLFLKLGNKRDTHTFLIIFNQIWHTKNTKIFISIENNENKEKKYKSYTEALCTSGRESNETNWAVEKEKKWKMKI